MARRVTLKRAAILFAATAFLAVFAPLRETMAVEDKAQSVPKVVPPPISPVIPDARLKAFGAASSEIMAIRQKYWPQVQAAPNEAEMQRLTEIARKEMMESIAKHGLTIKQYNEIVAAVRNDPALIKRIEKLEKGE